MNKQEVENDDANLLTIYFRFQFKDQKQRLDFWEYTQNNPHFETVFFADYIYNLNEKFEEIFTKQLITGIKEL